MPIPIVAPVLNNNSRTLLGMIHNLGLSTSLNFVLDAADTRSYDGSSQTWTDPVSANNFFLGADVTATATDPTFNGTAGLATEATYFSFDGGDYFTETTTHTFADEWHKNNGAFTIVALLYATNGASSRFIFGNTDGSGTDGIGIGFDSTEKVFVAHPPTNASTEIIGPAATALTADSWNFVALSFDEATTTARFHTNSVVDSVSMTASTATDANPNVLRIGATGAATFPLGSGERLAGIAGWSTAISEASVTNLYNLLKARRFTSLP